MLHRALADALRWNLIFVNPVSSVLLERDTEIRRDFVAIGSSERGISHRVEESLGDGFGRD